MQGPLAMAAEEPVAEDDGGKKTQLVCTRFATFIHIHKPLIYLFHAEQVQEQLQAPLGRRRNECSFYAMLSIVYSLFFPFSRELLEGPLATVLTL